MGYLVVLIHRAHLTGQNNSRQPPFVSGYQGWNGTTTPTPFDSLLVLVMERPSTVYQIPEVCTLADNGCPKIAHRAAESMKQAIARQGWPSTSCYNIAETLADDYARNPQLVMGNLINP